MTTINSNNIILRIKKNLFFITFSVSLLLIGLTNFLIDPYGRYGTDILKAKQIDPRTYIVNKLDSAYPPPKILFFGSSRTLLFKTEYSKDMPGINVSLYGGTIEDHYCILRYVIDDLGYPVKIVIIGLEPDLMASSHPIDKMLIKNKKLNRYLINEGPSTIQTFFTPPKYIDDISSLLSINSLRDSASLFFSFLQKIFGVEESYAAVNKKEKTHFAKGIIEKVTEVKDSLQARLRQYRKIYLDSDELSTVRIKYLNQFADFAQKHNIKVIMFYPGYSRPFWDEMILLKNFEKMHKQLDLNINELRAKYGWEILDFRPDKWHGQQLDFPDGVHPTEQSVIIMNNTIFGIINNDF